MESGYRQEPVGDGWIRFTVTPATPARRGSPWPLMAAILGAVIVLGAPRGGSSMQILPRFLIAFAIASVPWPWRWWRERREREGRSACGEFRVSARSLEVGGTAIDRGRLRYLRVRNTALPGLAPVTVSPGTIHDRVSRDRADDETAGLRGRAAVSFALCAGSDDGEVALAGGMSRSTAHGLLTDVSRILSVS